MTTPRQEPDRPHRQTSLPVIVIALVVVAAVGALGAAQTVDRVRVDTAVQATGQGEPGCVDRATFTGPDGVGRSVDVTVYKANCLDREPGEPLTVYYAADDPSVTASSRAWWWTLLPTLLALGMGAFLVRSGVRHVVSARRAPPR